jgi:hypothetical protein
MTEQFIRETAERFGLEVLKRITTGTDQAGFATFELSGPEASICAAWAALKPHGKGPDFDGIRHVSNPDHPDLGKPYIECGSVYFDR